MPVNQNLFTIALTTITLAAANVSLADSCGCDYDRDGQVGSSDLGDMLARWGTGEVGYDLDGDGMVNSADIGLLIAAWGPCPETDFCHSGSARLMSSWSGAPLDAAVAGRLVEHSDSPVTHDPDACATDGFVAFNGGSGAQPTIIYMPYIVQGDDILDVYAAIRDGAGVTDSEGNVFTAYTGLNLEVHMGCTDYYSSEVTFFSIADVRLSYVIQYPEWDMPENVAPAEVEAWKTIVDRIIEHEHGHVAIGEMHRMNLLMEAVGYLDGGFHRYVDGSWCPSYYGGDVIPGTDYEATNFENDAIEWLYDGNAWDNHMTAQDNYDHHTHHGDIWGDLAP